jgi:hypothetical protein
MTRPSGALRLLCCGLAVAWATLAAGCGGDAPPPIPEPPRVAIVFDPTVLSTPSVGALDSLINGVRVVWHSLPERACVAVLAVASGEVTEAPLYDHCFGFDDSVHGADRHRDSLQVQFERLTPLLKERWVNAHNDERQPNSCILSTIYRASDFLRPPGDTAVTRSRRLVIISDMMEICPEPGGLVLRPTSLVRTKAPFLLDLSMVSQVDVMQIPSTEIRSMAQDELLQAVWEGFFAEWRLPAGRLAWHTGLPRG